MVIGVAPSSIAAATTSAVNSISERVASIGENSTSSTNSRACATAARAWPSTSSRVVCSWWRMWMSEVEMKVWIRGRAASLTALYAASMSATCVRARPAITGGDAQSRELTGDLQLLLRVERDPRGLLAVAQRRVEDQYSVGVFRVGHLASACLRF